MRQKISAAALVLVIISVLLFGCGKIKDDSLDESKKNVVATIFPYYDMARAIIGDSSDIALSMSVTPGQDSHDFEPTPSDVIKMDEADVLIYNGGSMETWVEDVIEPLDGNGQTRIRMMDYVDVLAEEEVEGMEIYDNLDDDESDEHIWTSPQNAVILTEVICDALCEVFPEYREEFIKNADEYILEIDSVDKEIRKIIDKADTKEIIVADKFPILYFSKEYGLDYYAAFPGCGSDMEPSARTVAFLIDKVKEDNIKAVFYLETGSHTVADTISAETGAKALKFNSCHTVTKEQFEEGVTYVDLMLENAKNLKEAFN